MAKNTDLSRRSFVDWILGFGIVGSAVMFIYPVLRFVIPPPMAEAIEQSVVAGKLSELAPNSGKIVKFGRRPCLLIRTPGGEPRAFDGICTHLNCTVQYREDVGQIWCACHNGFYDLTGKNIAGPPPRPLPTFTVNVSDDEDVVISREG